ncbi:acyltransferase family protein [Streptomyces sp. NPDC003688]
MTLRDDTAVAEKTDERSAEETATADVRVSQAPSAQKEAAPARRKGRLAALDGLRFLAAVAVVVFHFTGQVPATMEHVWGRPYQAVFPDSHRYLAYGRLGVDLFFLISGFVICMSAWGRSPRDFFISRVTRLYPMYWIGVLVSAAVIYLFHSPVGNPNPRVLFANLTMLQKPLGVPNLDAVYWTLWPELCFYLTFSIVVWMGLTYTRVAVFCGIWTVAAVLAPAAHLPLMTVLVNPTSAPYFIAGMAFYLMYRFRPTPLLWGIVLMSWLLAMHFVLTPHGGRLNWATWHPWRGWLVLAISGCFALIAAIALGWTSRIQWRWLSVAGTLTFPLYLLHDVIGLTIVHHFGDRIDPRVLVVSTVAGLVVLSYVVHRLVERPIALYMRRWLNSASFGLEAPATRRG